MRISGEYLSSKYLKYIIIALILAVAGHSIAIYLFKVIDDHEHKINQLDKTLAVLEERINIVGRTVGNK